MLEIETRALPVLGKHLPLSCTPSFIYYFETWSHSIAQATLQPFSSDNPSASASKEAGDVMPGFPLYVLVLLIEKLVRVTRQVEVRRARDSTPGMEFHCC